MTASLGVCVVLGALLIGCGESTTRNVASVAGAGGDVSHVDPVIPPVIEPMHPPTSGGSGGSAGNDGGTGNVGGYGVSGGTVSGYGGGGGNGPDEPKLWELKRAAFLKIIGRPEVPLDRQETPKGQDGALVVEDFSIQSDASTRINGTTYRPGNVGPYPAVIYLHSTGGDRNTDNGFNKDLAARGFFVVTIDARYHGQGQSTDAYFKAIYDSYVSGEQHPFLYDTVWDVMRLVDYLEQRSDVDAERIGLVGRSKGGMETYLAAAVEPRIDVAVPWIGVQDWAWALDNDQWAPRVASIQGAVDQAAQHDGVGKIDAAYARRFYDRAVPGIYQQFDAIEMLAAICPRPLLAINGDSDGRTPLPGLRLIETATKQAYAAAGVPENFVLSIQPSTGHSVTPASFSATIDWFVRHLRP